MRIELGSTKIRLLVDENGKATHVLTSIEHDAAANTLTALVANGGWFLTIDLATGDCYGFDTWNAETHRATLANVVLRDVASHELDAALAIDRDQYYNGLLTLANSSR